MKLSKKLMLMLALTSAAYVPSSFAEEGYLSSVGHKFERGFSNLFMGVAEVPKNIHNNSEKMGYIAGGTSGLITGTLDTLGRTSSGIFDVITSPIPTKTLVEPEYVWNDFNKSSTFHANLR
ncbi:MAG TPA: exosortase system-associated protein, TIGR04073 family [Methylococcaceae bacterium]|nr:exosortase system-associated protein, TIGR04073 family [Methylococcaceae bacterium]